MRRVLIAGTGSGCGKTTITCAILQALTQRGLIVSSFKCGPDYIDPMLHNRITLTAAHNLDSFFCDTNTLRYLLETGGQNAGMTVIEGVMGFYDGKEGSAYAVSEQTETPVVLVIDCKGMSESIGAVMQGYLQFHTPNRIAGFIFNRLPEKLIPLAHELCDQLGTTYFGRFPVNAITLESRHLGLVTAEEISDFEEKMQQLGQLAEENILLDRLLALPDEPVPAYVPPSLPERHWKQAPVIAVAKDKAFCFHYAENWELLQRLGCKVRFFSPLNDTVFPADADGMILPGGYPELYAETLSRNTMMRKVIGEKIRSGMPCIAECGGFLYLHEVLKNAENEPFAMVGYISGEAYRVSRLQRFGYITMTAEQNNILCQKGERIRAHEFHYWESPDCGSGFTAWKADGRSWMCGHSSENLYAGFPHLYFYSKPDMAVRFADACAGFGGIHEQN